MPAPFRMRLPIMAAALLAVAFAHGANKPVQPAVGEVPPDALGLDRDGVRQTVSAHRGKVVIVTFWASWCAPCLQELPVLGKFRKVVGQDHLEVLAVNLHEPHRDYVGIARQNRDMGVTWIEDSDGSAMKQYGVIAVPNMFIIDREGRIAHVHHGYDIKSVQGFVEEIAALLPPEVLQRPAGG